MRDSKHSLNENNAGPRGRQITKHSGRCEGGVWGMPDTGLFYQSASLTLSKNAWLSL